MKDSGSFRLPDNLDVITLMPNELEREMKAAWEALQAGKPPEPIEPR